MTDELVCVGVSHHQTPVALRERICFPKEEMSRALSTLKNTCRIDEGLILSTCNRVELYAHGKSEDALASLETFISDYHQVPFLSLKPHLYRLKGQQVAQQFFRVASSLDSLVIGEAQILGQVKDAIHLAREAKALGPNLNMMLNHALMTAKRIRSETYIARHSVSISHIAVELIEGVFSSIKGRKALIVGAGAMAEVAARCLVQKGATLYLANRTVENAENLASLLGGTPFALSTLPERLVDCDIILTSTNAAGHLIAAKQVKSAMRKRRYRPLFFVDIAVPRNVDPLIGKIDGAYVYNVDDLSDIANKRLLLRAENGILAELILSEELERFELKQHERVFGPWIANLNAKGHSLADAEMDKVLAVLKDRISNDDAEKIKRATHGIVSKLLHEPIVAIKSKMLKNFEHS